MYSTAGFEPGNLMLTNPEYMPTSQPVQLLKSFTFMHFNTSLVELYNTITVA